MLFESDKTPSELGTRTDTCSFCTKHHAIYTADANGQLHITAQNESLIQRYRFGTKTADFLICKTCGVFVAAHMPNDALGVINVHVLDDRADFLATPLQIAELDGETLKARLARRRARWTPTRLM